jgi:erythromycin esterase-like protein
VSDQLLETVRRAAQWFEPSPDGFGSLLESIGDARLVLIGEATHGTHEFYKMRANLTRRLIVDRDFRRGGRGGRLAGRVAREPVCCR